MIKLEHLLSLDISSKAILLNMFLIKLKWIYNVICDVVTRFDENLTVGYEQKYDLVCGRCAYLTPVQVCAQTTARSYLISDIIPNSD